MDDFSHFQHSLVRISILFKDLKKKKKKKPTSLPDTQLKIKPFKLPPNEETKQETCLKSIEEAIQSEPVSFQSSIFLFFFFFLFLD